MRRATMLTMLALAAPVAWAHDPTATDGDKYRVLLENEQVRILGYEDRPGDRTRPHRHPAFVVVALAPFKRRLRLGDGRTAVREFAAGDVLYSAGEEHVGENVGDTPTRVILVELKGAAAAAAAARR
jgi:quercetin dioxygenase-like cupin family protein